MSRFAGARNVAWSAGVLLATALVAGCGDLPTAGAGGGADPVSAASIRGVVPERVVPAQGDQAELEQRVADRFATWAGSVDDYQAAEVIRAYSNNADQEECVEAAGEDWSGWEYAIGEVTVPRYYGVNPVAAPPVRDISFRYTLNERVREAEPLLHETPSDEGLARALDKCSFEIDSAGPLLGKMSEEEVGDLVTPDPLEKLTLDWKSVVDEVAAEHGSVEETIRCFVDQEPQGELQGVPPGVDGQGWVDVYDDALASAPRAAQGADMSEALDVESELMRTLWTCQQDSYDAVLRDLESASAEFAKSHSNEIRAARDDWAEVRALAGKMGWSPGHPLAGLQQ